MQTPRHIVLMGLRGSGKTTAGRELASRLGLAYTDLDNVTPRILGRESVAEAWQLDGEPAFRLAETRAISQVIGPTQSVIALGGGSPTAPGAAEILSNAARSGEILLIYLRASAASLRNRLETNGPGINRPSLTGKDPLQEIEDVLQKRDPLYRSLANVVIEVDGLDLETVVQRLMHAVQSQGPSSPR
jgi:shikimate kinase